MSDINKILTDDFNVYKKLDDKLRNVNTVKDYIALPRPYRETRHWWGFSYIRPYALAMADGELEGDLPLCSEWTKFDEYVKKEYPVQAFFRVTVEDILNHCRHRFRERYWSTRDWFFPQQRWLTKGAPNHWQDKKTLVVDVLYRMIVHFVEVEKAMENVVYDDTPDHIEFKQGLVECYKWIKLGRGDLLLRIEKESSEAGKLYRRIRKSKENKMKSYELAYGALNQLEKQLEETDTEMCEWIVQNRIFLWV